MKLLEAYYIKELHTPLNIQRKVYISSLQPSKQFNQGERNLESLSDTAIPVYVLKKEKFLASHPKRVLYVFSSLTKLKKEFQVDLSTLKPYINSEGNYYLGLFFFLLLVYLVVVI